MQQEPSTSGAAAKIRILTADDHPVVVDGLAALLHTQSDIEVIGSARSGRETVEKVLSLKPDVVLLDLDMPDPEDPEVDGIDTVRTLVARAPDVRIIIFTGSDGGRRIVAALEAGARAYLRKGTPREELIKAIRVVHDGGCVLPPDVATQLAGHVRVGKTTNQQRDAIPPLTPRELEVLQLLAKGLPNREIAEVLLISERTVKFHVRSLLTKLDATNRTEAVSVAVRAKLIEP